MQSMYSIIYCTSWKHIPIPAHYNQAITTIIVLLVQPVYDPNECIATRSWSLFNCNFGVLWLFSGYCPRMV